MDGDRNNAGKRQTLLPQVRIIVAIVPTHPSRRNVVDRSLRFFCLNMFAA